jgi:hypothetical protein
MPHPRLYLEIESSSTWLKKAVREKILMIPIKTKKPLDKSRGLK